MTKIRTSLRVKRFRSVKQTPIREIRAVRTWRHKAIPLYEDNANENSQLAFPGFRLPILATPMLHNLMRASPRDLKQQIARQMSESHYFEDHPECRHLFRACYLMAKGVSDEEHFSVLMKAGLGERFDHYTFSDFRLERTKLMALIRRFMEEYFSRNPTIVRALSSRGEPEKRDHKNFWPRFHSVWNSLTKKQRAALERVYMDQDRVSKEIAAKEFGISIDSLKSRLKTAIRKFKTEFSELIGISPKKLPRKMLKAALTHNNLWRYETAARKSKLYRIPDITSNYKVEINWTKLPRSRNLDWKAVARIKAEIIESCPVPYFHETEYFDNMKATIMSFGRSPGNLKEIGEHDQDEGFRNLVE